MPFATRTRRPLHSPESISCLSCLPFLTLLFQSLFVDVDLKKDHGETVSDMNWEVQKFKFKPAAGTALPSLTTVLNQFTSKEYLGRPLFDPPKVRGHAYLALI